MKAYSLDLRERVVAAVAGGASQQEAARRFAVGRATVQRWVSQAASGSLAPRPIPGRPRKIGPADEAALTAQVRATPDATLAEHCAAWEAAHRVRVSVATMHHALARLGWPRKKRPFTPASKIR